MIHKQEWLKFAATPTIGLQGAAAKRTVAVLVAASLVGSCRGAGVLDPGQRPPRHRWTWRPDSRTMAQNYGDLESDYAKFPCRMLCFFGHSGDRGRDPGFRRPGVGHDCVLDIRGSALRSPVLRSP